MRATAKRRIREGIEYDALFPPPSNEDKTVKKSADVEDTMSLIQRTVPKTLWHTEKIARKLKGNSLKETCSNIWHFVYGHIQYKRDKDGVEQVRSPRRTWWERETGVDCDCYTEFISSILLNLGIPHKARITKYLKPAGEIPRWQHVYPVVPVNGRLDEELNDRSVYITLDCVKDDFDSEQPYLESKDYDMRLDYLDGIEEEEVTEQPEYEYEEAENVDLADLASIYDDEELGNIFKKIGSAVKKVAKKVGTVVKKVGDKIGDGIRIINRFVNPVTILLRNGFLLAMKINLLNVAGRLRFAYLTDAQAKERNMNLASLKKVRSVKDRAETVYWQAGGKKANLKKAILSGKGNKDKKVPMNGLFGLDDEYMDMDEYNIIHSDPDNMEGLGEIASGAAIAAATSAVAAIAGALKQIKGLFNKEGDEKTFQSETDNAGDASSAPKVILESEDEIRDENETEESSSSAGVATQSDQSALPGSASLSRRPATDVQQSATTTPAPAGTNEGFIQKTTTWVRQNPGKSLLIAGAVAGGSYLLVKTLTGSRKQPINGMNGLSSNNSRKKKKRKSRNKKQKVQTIKF